MKTKLLKKNIPSGWQQVVLGDIADFKKGKGLPKNDLAEDGKHEAIHYGELFTKYNEEVLNVFSKTNNFSDVFLSKVNDILMPTSDVTPTGLSTASYLNKDGVILGGDILVIRAKAKVLNGLFFSYFVSANKKEVIKLVSGSTVYHLYGSDMAKLKFNLPPVCEQERIINVLQKCDRTIDKLKQVISSKKEVKKGLMQELLTGKKRVTGFKEIWRNIEIGNFCDIKRGGSPRPIDQYMTEDKDGLNWLKIGDVPKGSRYIKHTSGRIKKEGLNKTTVVEEGDFILSNSMSFGRPYIMKTSACIHDGWLALKNISKDVNKDFLYYLLSSQLIQNKFRSISAGSGVLNLKKESVAEVVVQMPEIKEQEYIAKILGVADDEIDKMEAKLTVLKEQKRYLLKNLITGTIRTPETSSIPK